MKISIKIKLPIIVLMAFALNIMALVTFTRLFAIDKIRYDLRTYINNVMETRNAIVNGIKEYYPDNRKIDDFIERVSAEKNILVHV